MKGIETAKKDLASIVAHLRQASTDALQRSQSGARVQFAIISRDPDGSGQVGASFDCEEFLSDLETVFPPSEDDKLDAQAACLASKVGL